MEIFTTCSEMEAKENSIRLAICFDCVCSSSNINDQQQLENMGIRESEGVPARKRNYMRIVLFLFYPFSLFLSPSYFILSLFHPLCMISLWGFLVFHFWNPLFVTNEEGAIEIFSQHLCQREHSFEDFIVCFCFKLRIFLMHIILLDLVKYLHFRITSSEDRILYLFAQ